MTSVTITEVSTPSPERPAWWFRGDIDGLRAIAIVMVVAFHAGVPGLRGGFTGVDVFFVISGYLITRNLVREIDQSRRVSLARFWARRVRRLVPALALVIVVTLIAARFVLSYSARRDASNHGLSAALYLSNMTFARQSVDYFAAAVDTSPFLHTWSLGVEEQFYVLWPLLIAVAVWVVVHVARSDATTATRRHAMVAVFGLVFAASMALNVVLSRRQSPYTFFSLPTRAWEFAAAGLVAALPPPRLLRNAAARGAVAVGGIALVFVAALSVNKSSSYPGLIALVPVAGTLLLILSGETWQGTVPRAPLSKLLASGPMQWLGRVSYSWYLWHWPAIALLTAGLGRQSVPLNVAVALATLPVAWLVYRYYETPIRFAPVFARSSVRTYAGGAAVTLCVALLALGIRPSVTPAMRQAESIDATLAQLMAPTGSSLGQQVDFQVALYRNRVTSTCPKHGVKTPAGDIYCIGGDSTAKRSILLLGDSHAGQWRRPLDQLAKERGLRLLVREHDGCIPFAVTLQEKTADAAGHKSVCRDQEAGDIRVIRALHPTAVIIATSTAARPLIVDERGRPTTRDGQAALWLRALSDQVEAIRRTGATVGQIIDEPALPGNASACLIRTNRAKACNYGIFKVWPLSGPLIAAERKVAAKMDVPSLDLPDIICTRGVCRMEIGGVLVYVDTHHLTDAFAMSQKRALGTLVDRLVS